MERGKKSVEGIVVEKVICNNCMVYSLPGKNDRLSFQ